MQISTSSRYEINTQDARQGRIVVTTTVDGHAHDWVFMTGDADLVEEYFSGAITLERYQELERIRFHRTRPTRPEPRPSRGPI